METLRSLTEIAIYVAGSFCVSQENHDLVVLGYIIRTILEI